MKLCLKSEIFKHCYLSDPTCYFKAVSNNYTNNLINSFVSLLNGNSRVVKIYAKFL